MLKSKCVAGVEAVTGTSKERHADLSVTIWVQLDE
jgi:hypothetical protein